MLWENSSVVVAVVAAVVVLARYFLDNFSKKSSFLVIFYQKLTFRDIVFLQVVFSPKNFRRRHACPHFSAFIFEKIYTCHQKVIIFCKKSVISDKKHTFFIFGVVFQK